MKFTTPLILGTLCVFAAAGPTSETNQTIDGTLVPELSILGGLSIPNDVYPILTYKNNTATVVFLNSTILAKAKASNAEVSDTHLARRDAKADADAGFHWVSLKIGQPFFKRDAEANAGFHWVSLKIGQPFFKRDAEADAGFHWVSLKIGQPFF